MLEGNNTIDVLVKSCISKLTDEGIFDSDGTGFNVDKGHISIKDQHFTGIRHRNTTTAGALDKEENGEICISESYESDFTQIRNRKKYVGTIAKATRGTE